ncbi:MAG TPA: HAD family hydrolase [Solirubrobacterales bacterium]|nr:HAD family hydrolase [Solirubrobacterales bacterium]
MSTPVKAVTFDFWNTIASVPSGAMETARQEAVIAACEAHGLEVEAGLLASHLDQVGESYHRSWSEGLHFHPRQGAEMLALALGAEGEAGEQVAAAFLGAGRGAQLELSPGIRECLGALSEQGLRLGIVCDVGFTGGELLRGILEAEGLLTHFSGWGFSDEVGHYKPAPEIFEAALYTLGATPAEAVHVGDLRRTDIAGAQALGMGTVRYRALNDDPDPGAEADHVLDDHRDLPALIARLA